MSRTKRRGDTGVTLVEMLVVIALVGLVAGAVALGIGPAARATDARTEGELLAARMRRASEEAVLTGQAVALDWTARDYRFLVPEDPPADARTSAAWSPHPVPLLGTPKATADGLVLAGEGRFVVTGAALPLEGVPLVLAISPEGQEAALAVLWDGAMATLREPPP